MPFVLTTSTRPEIPAPAKVNTSPNPLEYKYSGRVGHRSFGHTPHSDSKTLIRKVSCSQLSETFASSKRSLSGFISGKNRLISICMSTVLSDVWMTSWMFLSLLKQLHRQLSCQK